MIDWFTWTIVGVSLAVGLTCIGFTVAGKGPRDLTVLGVVLVELLVIAQIVMAIIAPGAGNPPTGNPLEFWMYLVTAAIIPPAAIVWALMERTRWGSLILAVAGLAICIMTVRMWAIWTIQGV